MAGPDGATADARTVEVVLFTVGKRLHLAAREDVKTIRPSLRVRRAVREVTARTVHSLSRLLGLDRDVSVDRRILEVEYWGERVGLEVTSIQGIRHLDLSTLHPLPTLVRRNCSSSCVLGLVVIENEDPEKAPHLGVVLDLPGLLAEQGVALSEKA